MEIINDMGTLKELAKLNNPYNTYVKAVLKLEKDNFSEQLKVNKRKRGEAEECIREIEMNPESYTYGHWVRCQNNLKTANKQIELLLLKKEAFELAIEIAMDAIDQLKK